MVRRTMWIKEKAGLEPTFPESQTSDSHTLQSNPAPMSGASGPLPVILLSH